MKCSSPVRIPALRCQEQRPLPVISQLWDFGNHLTWEFSHLKNERVCLMISGVSYSSCCCAGSSVAKSCRTLQPHELQHARLPCPSLSPGVCSNSCPLSQWCHPTITSSVSPFSSCPQSFPASGSFPESRLCTSGGHSIGVSVSPSIFPIQGWFPLGLSGLISLQSKGLSRVFSSTTIQKHQSFSA